MLESLNMTSNNKKKQKKKLKQKQKEALKAVEDSEKRDQEIRKDKEENER